MTINKLYFGDCLDVMQQDIESESVDLIYLDPPFNSKRIYNASMGGAQWVAFKDTWHWHEAIDDFHAVAGDVQLSGTMEGMRLILGEGCNLAYLSYMANRLRECRRVLKNTGSIYLHCDPTMSAWLRLMLSAIFGHQNFLNEIIWHYTGGGRSKTRFSKKHDVLFWYSKRPKEHLFNIDQVRVRYKPTSGYAKSGIRAKSGKKYMPSPKGTPVDDVWEIPIINPMSRERVGYPTQKPLALLKRILKASSNPGDVVFDPFCGCGTTIHAAQALGRQWIGIDICVTACQVIEKRLRENFDSIWSDVEFIGMPKTADDAKTLANIDKFKFEKWAASLVPWMEANKVQRGDGGIDGRGRLPVRKGQFVDVVSQVKGGGTGPGDVQAFNGARQQVGADMGIFTCFEERVTYRMRDAAASAGKFMGAPVVQIYTVEDFFERREPKLPSVA